MTATFTPTAARVYNHDYEAVAPQALALMDDPDLPFPVLRDAVLATPALSEFGGNREVATLYLRLSAGEVSLAFALARYGMSTGEVQRAACGLDHYCLAYVPAEVHNEPCWHPLTDSGACPNVQAHR